MNGPVGPPIDFERGGHAGIGNLIDIVGERVMFVVQAGSRPLQDVKVITGVAPANGNRSRLDGYSKSHEASGTLQRDLLWI